jgi:hypothetical protein
MSEPAWLYKLEDAMFRTGNDPAQMIEWILKTDEIPQEKRRALLQKYDYTPTPIEPQPKRRGRPAKVKQDD